jgi:hypothetical protein
MAGHLLSIPLLIAALVLVGWVARYAFSQGMHTVIASQTASASANAPSMSVGPLSGCGLDSQMRQENPLRCQMEMRQAAADAQGENYRLVYHASQPPGAPLAPATMTKAESETATGWITMAMVAIPLSLLIAGVLGFLVYAAATADRSNSWD